MAFPGIGIQPARMFKQRQKDPVRMTSQPGSMPMTKPASKPRYRCNGLNGKQWLQNSISIWSDIAKTPQEAKLKHPALFPSMLVERLIETFLPPSGRVVFDPFAGSGSTVVTAAKLGKQGIGLELSADYATLANRRLAECEMSRKTTPGSGDTSVEDRPSSVVHHASAADLLTFVEPGSVDLCVSSPPYWNILNQRRTADRKGIRHYGNLDGDLGFMDDYEEFLDAVTAVFADVLTALKPRAYCCVVVMDIRKQNRFFPLHSDLAGRLAAAGYVYDDLIIWNRQAEYNNLRPLGYPSVFRVNKVHEYILLMQKPFSSRTA
jgi:DNA modification methylase